MNSTTTTTTTTAEVSTHKIIILGEKESLQQGMHEESTVTYEGEKEFLIHKFNSLPNRVGEFIETKFTLCSRHWIMKFFPGGDDDKSVGFISAFISSDPPNREVPISISLCYSISVVGRMLMEHNSTKISTLISGDGLGILKMISREELICGFHNGEDTLILKMKMRLHGFVPKSKLTLVSDISELFKSGSGSDLIIRVDDKKQFRVHKMILIARSNVFKAMLDGSFKEGNKQQQQEEQQQSIVEIKEIESNIMENVLSFIYCGEIHQSLIPENVSIDWWISLLFASDRFAIKDLFEICEMKIISFLTTSEHAALCFSISNQISDATKLKQSSIEFFRTHDISDTDVDKFDINSAREFIKLICGEHKRK